MYQRTFWDKLEDNYNKLSEKTKNFLLALILIIISFILLVIKDNLLYIGDGVNYIVRLLTPFLVAFIIAYIISKPINYTRNLLVAKIFKNPITSNFGNSKEIKIYNRCDKFSILLIYTILTLLLILATISIIPQITNLIKVAIESSSDLSKIITNYIQSTSKEIGIEVNEIYIKKIGDILENYSNQIKDFISNNTEKIADIMTGIGRTFNNFVLGYIISIYIMLERDKFSKSLNDIILAYAGNRTYLKIFKTAEEIKNIFNLYIKATVLDCFIVFILVLIPCLIFDVKYTLYISLAVAIVNIIPIFGAFIGIFLPTICLLFIDVKSSITYMIIDIAVQCLDANIIKPKLMGNKVGLSSFWIIFSLVVFGSLLGTVGVVFGVPIFAAIVKFTNKKVNYKVDEVKDNLKRIRQKNDIQYEEHNVNNQNNYGG